MGNFLKDIKTGKVGEIAVAELLNKYEEVEFIVDVSKEKTFQGMDIDLLVFTTDGLIAPIEVKTDTMAHRTGNFVYEVYSSKTRETQGCNEKTKAQYIFYYLRSTKEIYAINNKKYKNHIEKNYKGKVEMRNMGDNAKGYLVKIKELLENDIAYKLK